MTASSGWPCRTSPSTAASPRRRAPGGGHCAGRSPVDRGKLGMKRSLLTDGYGIPLGWVLAPASRNDSPLLVDAAIPA